MSVMEDKLAAALLSMLKGSHVEGYFDCKTGEQARGLAEQALKEYKEKKEASVHQKIVQSINHLTNN